MNGILLLVFIALLLGIELCLIATFYPEVLG